MTHQQAKLEPVGGPVLTKPFIVLGILAAVAMAFVLWRFIVGLGPATALSDGYPWGTWKILNVIVLTALGSGGYATAMLVYALNHGRYHPIARTAILTSALGYTSGIFALTVDIGRPWNIYQLALIWNWNLHSVLLEVALCISVYLIFLWIEMAPPFLEKWKESGSSRLKRLAAWATPKLDFSYPFVVAAAITLPSMHQSSLGSLFLLAGPRVHPLWQTPIVPGLFLLSCWFLGYACVVLVSLVSSYTWKRPLETRMLGSLSRVVAWVILAFVLARFVDVTVRGELELAFKLDFYSIVFLVETGMLLASAAGLLNENTRKKPGAIMRWAMLAAIGGSLYRLDVALVAFMPGHNWNYFPSVIELIITLGFIAVAIMAYLYLVKRYPILPAPVPKTVGSVAARPH